MLTVMSLFFEQDSIMALKALTAYGERDTNRELYNIEVQVQATSMSTNDFDEYVKLNQNNWMQMQNVDVSCVEQVFLFCRAERHRFLNKQSFQFAGSNNRVDKQPSTGSRILAAHGHQRGELAGDRLDTKEVVLKQCCLLSVADSESVWAGEGVGARHRHGAHPAAHRHERGVPA